MRLNFSIFSKNNKKLSSLSYLPQGRFCFFLKKTNIFVALNTYVMLYLWYKQRKANSKQVALNASGVNV
jgi:hypothetical protein